MLWQLPATSTATTSAWPTRSSTCRPAATPSSSVTRAGSPTRSALLRAHGVALAIGDHPERPFQSHELTADFTFVRFHHGRRGRRGNYARRELDEWARRDRALARRAEVFAYFNNDWEGFAVRNALGSASAWTGKAAPGIHPRRDLPCF